MGEVRCKFLLKASRRIPWACKAAATAQSQPCQGFAEGRPAVPAAFIGVCEPRRPSRFHACERTQECDSRTCARCLCPIAVEEGSGLLGRQWACKGVPEDGGWGVSQGGLPACLSVGY